MGLGVVWRVWRKENRIRTCTKETIKWDAISIHSMSSQKKSGCSYMERSLGLFMYQTDAVYQIDGLTLLGLKYLQEFLRGKSFLPEVFQ
jgi:hypothetical protein